MFSFCSLCVSLNDKCQKKLIELLYLPHKMLQMHQNLINTIPRMLMQTVAVAGVAYQRLLSGRCSGHVDSDRIIFFKNLL